MTSIHISPSSSFAGGQAMASEARKGTFKAHHNTISCVTQRQVEGEDELVEILVDKVPEEVEVVVWSSADDDGEGVKGLKAMFNFNHNAP